MTFQELHEVLDQKFKDFKTDFFRQIDEKRIGEWRGQDVRRYMVFTSILIVTNLLTVFTVHIAAR